MDTRSSPLRPAVALREAWRDRRPGWLRSDLLAGLVVGIVAVPLSMALAIASGAPPQAGLNTAIVAGGLVALLGGSRHQVSGPTAAFVVILVPIGARFGLGGLAIATMLAGLLLIGLALLRFGRLIQFVPYPVTMGFTAGIAVVIATLQIPGLLALTLAPLPPDAHYPERAAALWRALPSIAWGDALVGSLTLALLLWWPRTKSRVPGALVGLLACMSLAWVLARVVPGFEIETVRSRFGTAAHPAGIPQVLPHLVAPWKDLAGAELTFGLVRQLFPSAVAIALLAALESLLSAVVADGATGTQHDPDAELLALGIGNLVVPLFGGLAATGALARTATNIRSGAHSPFAALFHALFVLAAVLLLAPLLGHLPMCGLAALLLVVAWNMSEARHVLRVLREAPRSDAAVLIVCFGLTVLFDMTIAVSVGFVLAAILFMRRMVEISHVRLLSGEAMPEHGPLPAGVLIYEIGGPLFFGAAHKATSILRRMAPDTRVLIMDFAQVPAIDASGLFNLRSALDRLGTRGVRVLFASLRPQPLKAMTRARLVGPAGSISTHADLGTAISAARTIVAQEVPR